MFNLAKWIVTKLSKYWYYFRSILLVRTFTGPINSWGYQILDHLFTYTVDKSTVNHKEKMINKSKRALPRYWYSFIVVSVRIYL